MSTQRVHHPEYYIPSGDLYILVNEVLFKVHSFFFERESSRYRDIINTPVALGASRPGTSDTNPLVIKNSGPQEFAKFLWVFYNTKYSMYKATSAEWVWILKIACEYNFPEVKALAIRGIQKGGSHTIFQLIRIYQLYKVNASYLIPLYIILCKRDEAPTAEETKELGLETTLLIFRLREAVRSRIGDGSKSPLPSNLDEDDILRAICSTLGVEHSLGGSLRRRSPIATRRVEVPRQMSTSPESPRRRTNSMQEPPNREAFVLDQVVCPGPEGCQYAAKFAEENNVAYKKDLGWTENWKKDLRSKSAGGNSGNADSISSRVESYMVAVRSKGSLVGVFLVMPVRTILFLVGVAWTAFFIFFLRTLLAKTSLL